MESALDRAVEAGKAAVFIHLSWAPMEHQRRKFEALAAAYTQGNPDRQASFHYIDFTCVSGDYAPLARMNGWREIHARKGVHPIHGYGEVAWIRHGRLVDIESIRDRSIEELVSRGEEIFATD